MEKRACFIWIRIRSTRKPAQNGKNLFWSMSTMSGTAGCWSAVCLTVFSWMNSHPNTSAAIQTDALNMTKSGDV